MKDDLGASPGVDQRLEQLARQRVLVKSGPLGSALLALGLSEPDFRGERFARHARQLAGNCDLLVLTRPELVERVHTAYLEAGADLIETNTFNAQAISQAQYGLEEIVYELNLAAARLSRRLADRFSERDAARPRFVLGNLGPSRVCLSRPDATQPAVSFEQLRAAYAEQARALIEGGVHALIAETIVDPTSAAACWDGIEVALADSGRTLPVLWSVSLGRDGRLAAGGTLADFVRQFAPRQPFGVGINCSWGALPMRPALETLASLAAGLVSAYPNAGLPDAAGRYAQGPEACALPIAGFAADGLANIVGGCCGTTPELVRSLTERLRGVAPRAFDSWRRPPIR